MAYGIFLICGFTVWARGGVHAPFQWPLIVMTLLLCGGTFYLRPKLREDLCLKVLQDPVFKLGGIFLILVILQCLNFGYRVEPTESGILEFTRSPPWWFPWSPVFSEASEMLVWFFPTWIFILLARNLLSRRHLKPLLYLVAWNSAVLACVGILHHMVDSSRMLGLWKMPYGSVFFATFEYSNHAAEWFYLNAFLAGGFAHDALVRDRPKMQQAIWCITFLLCIVSVFLTLSRFGALISSILLAVAIAVYLKHVLNRVRGTVSINIYMVVCIAILGGLALFAGAGGGRLADEMKATSVAKDMGGRIRQLPSAWSIIRDYPVFGAGGQSYRWLAPLYVDEENQGMLKGMAGKYVHCDPVQFFSEFGFLGIACLGAVVGLLFMGCHKTVKDQGVLYAWLLCGLCVIAVHSWVDLPFRNPAILYEWAIILSALPKLPDRRKSLSTDIAGTNPV